MFEEQLVKMINSGSCLALVGAGLSREIGYPDWTNLAEQTAKRVKDSVDTIDEASYSKYLKDRKYPELFSQAERDLQSREKLESLVSKLLEFTPATLGSAYKYICNWPFACYLTTNFDNEVQRHLQNQSIEFSIKDNTPVSLSNLRNDTRDVIFKLHSALHSQPSQQSLLRTIRNCMHTGAVVAIGIASRQCFRNLICSLSDTALLIPTCRTFWN